MRKILSISAILIIWAAVTHYFVTLHNIDTREAEVNKTIILDNFTVELDKVILYNAERIYKGRNFGPSEEIKYSIVSGLPYSLASFFLRLDYLYSKPYKIDNELLHTALTGKVISTGDDFDKTDLHEYLRQHLEIDLVDSAGSFYGSSFGTRYEKGKPEIVFRLKSYLFPIERLPDGFTIIVRDNISGKDKKVRVEAEEFVTRQYNDAFGSTVFSVDWL